MSVTYFDLVKECLVEMFYSEPKTWEDTNTTEGIKVKRLLNQALRSVCLGEQIPWKFREQHETLVLVPGINKYPKPDGFIINMRYVKELLRLYYNAKYVDLPMDSAGQPIQYWIYDGNINLYPTPSKDFSGEQILIHYLTNKCARDKYGVLKESMECECDMPVIPEAFRDILVWAVCRDFRRSATDATSAYYDRRYKETYKALLADQRLSDDYPNGLDINPYIGNMQDVVLNVFYNPRAGQGGDYR